jgi:hypothetical protein
VRPNPRARRNDEESNFRKPVLQPARKRCGPASC